MIWLFPLLVSCSVCLWTGSSVTHPIKCLIPTLHPQWHRQTHPHPPPSVSPWLISLFLQSGFLSFHHSPSGSILSKHAFLKWFQRCPPPSITLNRSFKFTRMTLNRFHTIPFHPVLCLLFGKSFALIFASSGFFYFIFFPDWIKLNVIPRKEPKVWISPVCNMVWEFFAPGKSEHISCRISAY